MDFILNLHIYIYKELNYKIYIQNFSCVNIFDIKPQFFLSFLRQKNYDELRGDYHLITQKKKLGKNFIHKNLHKRRFRCDRISINSQEKHFFVHQYRKINAQREGNFFIAEHLFSHFLAIRRKCINISIYLNVCLLNFHYIFLNGIAVNVKPTEEFLPNDSSIHWMRE